MAFIDVRDLRVSFGTRKALIRAVDGVNFSVEPGEVFGLVGESGCGKSTILRALCGLNADWTGDIEINGIAMTPKRSREFYKLTQMVFQDPYGSLHPRQTVNTALLEPIKIHRLDNPNDRVLQALSDVGLGPTFRFRFPHQLSGGQRQRVAIARALVLEPKLLLLDEPTSALDVSVQAEILNLFRELHQNLGLTYILVTHDLSVISHLCDRIAVMYDGRILEQLDVQGLTDNSSRHPYTQELFRASAGYDRRLAASVDSLMIDTGKEGRETKSV
jgi:peptide/nickel transport system ATP-binding protein